MLEGAGIVSTKFNGRADHTEQAIDALASIRKVNKTDAKNLLQCYGSLREVIQAENYEEFLNIDGIGQQKIDTITHCFKGKFHQYVTTIPETTTATITEKVPDVTNSEV